MGAVLLAPAASEANQAPIGAGGKVNMKGGSSKGGKERSKVDELQAECGACTLSKCAYVRLGGMQLDCRQVCREAAGALVCYWLRTRKQHTA